MLAYNLGQAQQLNLSLYQCREMALENSENLKIAIYQNEQAEAEKKVAWSGYFPNISASAMYNYSKGKIEIADNYIFAQMPQNFVMDLGEGPGMYMLGASLQQPIYTGGKVVYGNKMANKGIEISEENIILSRSDVIAEAEKAYWHFFLVKDKIKLIEQYNLLLDSLNQNILAFINADMATQNDQLKITSRQSNIQYEKQRTETMQEICRMQLCNIIGIDLNTEIVLTDSINIPNMEPFLNIYDVTQRPEYKILQKQVEMKEINVKLVRADYLPTIGLMAGYNYLDGLKFSGTKLSMSLPSVMLSASIPIFSFGQGKNKIKSAKFAYNIQQQELEKNRKLMDIEAKNIERGLQDAFKLIYTAEIALEQSSANLELITNRYEHHFATIIDVLDAQTQWQEAYSNLIDAQVSYKIKEIDYLKVFGKL